MSRSYRTITLRFAIRRESLTKSAKEVHKLVAEGVNAEEALRDEAEDLTVYWIDITGDDVEEEFYGEIYALLKSEVAKASNHDK